MPFLRLSTLSPPLLSHPITAILRDTWRGRITPIYCLYEKYVNHKVACWQESFDADSSKGGAQKRRRLWCFLAEIKTNIPMIWNSIYRSGTCLSHTFFFFFKWLGTSRPRVFYDLKTAEKNAYLSIFMFQISLEVKLVKSCWLSSKRHYRHQSIKWHTRSYLRVNS